MRRTSLCMKYTQQMRYSVPVSACRLEPESAAGTFGGVTPVREVDGRVIGHGLASTWEQDPQFPGPMVHKIRELYNRMVIEECGGL